MQWVSHEIILWNGEKEKWLNLKFAVSKDEVLAFLFVCLHGEIDMLTVKAKNGNYKDKKDCD